MTCFFFFCLFFFFKIGNVSAVEFVIVIRFQTAFYFRTVFLVFLFSLYLSEVRVPLPTFSFSKKFHITRYPLFKLLPVSHFYEMHAFYFHLVLLHYVLHVLSESIQLKSGLFRVCS